MKEEQENIIRSVSAVCMILMHDKRESLKEFLMAKSGKLAETKPNEQ